MSTTDNAKNETPRIYVACLSAYNNGWLHGRWIDAAQDADDIYAEVQSMLAASPEPGAEEWAIHDFDGFRGIKLAEYESFANVSAIATFLEEHGDAAVAAWDHASDLEEACRLLDECYQGAWDSLEAWAENLLDDTGDLNAMPENLRNYFDYEAYARDCELGGDIFSTELHGQVHVFWSR